MMTNLVMTRLECAKLIDKFAGDLRYYTEVVCDLASKDDLDTEYKMTVELQIRQMYCSIVELLKVMYDLM